VKVSVIVAVASNGVIGRGGELPWHLPDDLARFKALTMGHHLIVGRRTWESIGRPLPGRRILVVTSRDLALPEGVVRAGSLDEALGLAAAGGEEETFVGGGARLYAEALPRADRIYLTRVLEEVAGDTSLPPLDAAAWRLVAREEHRADDRHAHRFAFEVLERS
jgi:dihydrofolate reductase